MRQLVITKQITNRNKESINKYFQDISKYDLINCDEEIELTRRIKNGDSTALKKLITANLRFVVSVAKQYQNQGVNLEDLINEGNIGLINAAAKYDETKGFKFISYAVWWIRQSIIQAISDHTRIVHLPLNMVSAINKITKAFSYLEQKLEREPSNNEIAEYLDLTFDKVRLVNISKKHYVSFDMPLMQDNDTELNLYDFIQTGNVPLPDNNMMKESIVTNIKRALNKLTEIEAAILTMFFGLSNTPICSLHSIAIKYDMSSERIRQIKSNGLFKLKILLKGKRSFLGE